MFRNLPKNVVILGIVSFFNDVASEMIYPIVPLFLTMVLHAPVSVVGLIEGIAEATSSIMKFLFGYLSDRVHKRKIFVAGGYSFAALSKLLIAIASSWHFVLFARFIDRLGKGLRTSARDSLLLQNATQENKGFIFGFHRSLDSLGAVIGPLLALWLLTLFRNDMRTIFFIAFIPACISVLLLLLFVKEKKVTTQEKKYVFVFQWKNISPGFKLFFFISIIFSLGNSSDVFLILRSQQLGLTTTMTILAYVIYNIFQTIFATPAGRVADKIGARRVYGAGLLIFSIVYFFFGFIHHTVWIWVLFPLYGLYIAFTDGVSKSYIAEFITEKESGTYFGLYQMGIALSAFLASVVGGILWSKIGPFATFYFGAIMAFCAFLLLGYGKLAKKI